jgi:acetyl-CoA carboxylase biotin carboxyl carrier protein
LSERKNIRKKAAPAATGPMDVSLLEQIVKLMAANDLNTVEVRDGEKRIVLKRGAPVPAAVMMAPAAVAPAAPVAAAASASAPAAAKGDDEAGLKAIKSPMVGTFYSSPSPDAKPFVAVGSVVDEETDVCIIEAMKVFNEIKAEVSGRITRILAKNAQAVEYDQPLFAVAPA